MYNNSEMRVGFDMQALVGGGATGLGMYARGVLYAMELLTEGKAELPDIRRDLPGSVTDRLGMAQDWWRTAEIVRLYPNITERPLASAGARIWWEQVGLPRAIQSENIDVIYSPALGTPIRQERPKVLVVHDLIPLHEKKKTLKLSEMYFTRYLPKCYLAADYIVFHTETVRQEFLSLFPKFDNEKTFVVPAFPACLVPSLYPPTSGGGWYYPGPKPDELELLPHDRREGFICIATFEERKNLGLALDAYSRLDEEVREKHPLIFIGKGGEEREFFWQMIEDGGMSRYVKLTGYVPQQILITYLRKALALIFPSTDEGFGMPPLEAMSLGTPAIVSDAPAVKETYDGICPAVGSSDAASLAEEMMRLAAYPKHWHKLSQSGISFAKEFTPERSAVVSLAALWLAVNDDER
ncbi:glycosyltransferase family 4 protein [bacterium]|nr:glycosyltransferase family 4 protein [bacterium]